MADLLMIADGADVPSQKFIKRDQREWSEGFIGGC